MTDFGSALGGTKMTRAMRAQYTSILKESAQTDSTVAFTDPPAPMSIASETDTAPPSVVADRTTTITNKAKRRGPSKPARPTVVMDSEPPSAPCPDSDLCSLDDDIIAEALYAQGGRATRNSRAQAKQTMMQPATPAAKKKNTKNTISVKSVKPASTSSAVVKAPVSKKWDIHSGSVADTEKQAPPSAAPEPKNSRKPGSVKGDKNTAVSIPKHDIATFKSEHIIHVPVAEKEGGITTPVPIASPEAKNFRKSGGVTAASIPTADSIPKRDIATYKAEDTRRASVAVNKRQAASTGPDAAMRRPEHRTTEKHAVSNARPSHETNVSNSVQNKPSERLSVLTVAPRAVMLMKKNKFVPLAAPNPTEGREGSGGGIFRCKTTGSCNSSNSTMHTRSDGISGSVRIRSAVVGMNEGFLEGGGETVPTRGVSAPAVMSTSSKQQGVGESIGGSKANGNHSPPPGGLIKKRSSSASLVAEDEESAWVGALRSRVTDLSRMVTALDSNKNNILVRSHSGMIDAVCSMVQDQYRPNSEGISDMSAELNCTHPMDRYGFPHVLNCLSMVHRHEHAKEKARGDAVKSCIGLSGPSSSRKALMAHSLSDESFRRVFMLDSEDWVDGDSQKYSYLQDTRTDNTDNSRAPLSWWGIHEDRFSTAVPTVHIPVPTAAPVQNNKADKRDGNHRSNGATEHRDSSRRNAITRRDYDDRSNSRRDSRDIDRHRRERPERSRDSRDRSSDRHYNRRVRSRSRDKSRSRDRRDMREKDNQRCRGDDRNDRDYYRGRDKRRRSESSDSRSNSPRRKQYRRC